MYVKDGEIILLDNLRILADIPSIPQLPWILLNSLRFFQYQPQLSCGNKILNWHPLNCYVSHRNLINSRTERRGLGQYRQKFKCSAICLGSLYTFLLILISAILDDFPPLPIRLLIDDHVFFISLAWETSLIFVS